MQSKGFSRVFSNTTVQKPQFFSAQLSLWSSSHVHTELQRQQSAVNLGLGVTQEKVLVDLNASEEGR